MKILKLKLFLKKNIFYILKELDWDIYKKKYKNIQRLDFILKAEGDSPDNYKASKQPGFISFLFFFNLTNHRYLYAILSFKS